MGERGDPLDVRREADAAERLVEAVEEVAHLGGGGGGGVEGDQGEIEGRRWDGLEVGRGGGQEESRAVCTPRCCTVLRRV